MKPQSISDSGISADFRNLAGAINLRSSCTQELQQSQTSDTVSSAPDKRPALQIPDGTPIEIEAPYTFRSMDFKPNDKISFRVVDPVKIHGITVIEQGATATGRINKSKRGGHWGKAGLLVWTMQTVTQWTDRRFPSAQRRFA